jgi:2-dehydropantoate 2-reductase
VNAFFAAQRRGATITGLVDFMVPVHVVTAPQQVHEADVLMVTVKTYDMDAALASVKHLNVASVLSIQNGVLKNEQLAQTFGWDKVLGAMAAFSGAVLPTGTVRFTVNEGLYLGELPAGTSARVQTLGDTLERSGMRAKVTPSIQSFEWAKYLGFVSWMAPAVLTRLETYKFLQAAPTAAIVAAIVHEMTQIAMTRAIVLEDIPLFPTKTLSQLSYDVLVTQLQQMGTQLASQAPLHKVSTLQDVEQGKRLEVEETLGYAVRQGAALGVPTPTMDLCYNLIAGINHYLQ